jgi:hypothetical protein
VLRGARSQQDCGGADSGSSRRSTSLNESAVSDWAFLPPGANRMMDFSEASSRARQGPFESELR